MNLQATELQNMMSINDIQSVQIECGLFLVVLRKSVRVKFLSFFCRHTFSDLFHYQCVGDGQSAGDQVITICHSSPYKASYSSEISTFNVEKKAEININLRFTALQNKP